MQEFLYNFIIQDREQIMNFSTLLSQFSWLRDSAWTIVKYFLKHTWSDKEEGGYRDTDRESFKAGRCGDKWEFNWFRFLDRESLIAGGYVR